MKNNKSNLLSIKEQFAKRRKNTKRRIRINKLKRKKEEDYLISVNFKNYEKYIFFKCNNWIKN